MTAPEVVTFLVACWLWAKWQHAKNAAEYWEAMYHWRDNRKEEKK